MISKIEKTQITAILGGYSHAKQLADISGDLNKALLWYRNDGIEAFDFKTAEELVSAGRTDDLLAYLMSLQAGFVG